MMSNILIGRTLNGIKIAADKGAILFQTDAGDVVARADGDCCSHTWVESIALPALGFPALVQTVADLDMPDLGSPDEYECIAYYGCKIVTDKGEIIIDYRNESNGYYGGSLEWPSEDGRDYFYGGVHGQNVSKEEWTEVAP